MPPLITHRAFKLRIILTKLFYEAFEECFSTSINRNAFSHEYILYVLVVLPETTPTTLTTSQV